MKLKLIEADETPDAVGGYSEALLVSDTKEHLFISGQIPVDRSGAVPEKFEDQARLVWKNISYLLNASNMDISNIVKHTTYLSSREYTSINSEVRQEVLGQHRPALTVVIADIYNEKWLLEVEVIAMR